MESNLPLNLTSFIAIFQIFGFVMKYKNVHRSIDNILWILLNLFLFFVEVIYIWILRKTMFYTTDPIGQMFDIVQIFLPLATHLIMILESIVKYKTQMKIFDVIKEIDFTNQQLRSINANDEKIPVNVDFPRNFLIKFILILTICFVSETNIIALIYDSAPRWAISWYFRFWTLNCVRVGILHLIFYVDWMAGQLYNVNRTIDCMSSQRFRRLAMEFPSRKATNNKDEIEKVFAKINLLTNQYANLWLLADYCNFRFSFSILILLINYFLVLTGCMYWSFVHVYFNHEFVILGVVLFAEN